MGAIHERARRGVRLALGAAALAVLVSSCSRPTTQLIAVLETDAATDVYECVRVEVVRYPRETPPRGGTLGLLVPAQVTLPFSTGIVPPDQDARARVEVIAELRRDTCADRAPGEAPPRVSRTVRTGFLPDQTLRLPIFLADRCVDVLCGPEETCDGTTGTCVPIPEIDPRELMQVSAGEELGRDAGSLDAGSLDAGARPDAPIPATCSTVGTMVGRNPNGDILAFGLAQSADGSRGVRSVVFGNGMGGIDLSGSSLGSGFFAIGCRGPTGVALLDDGSRGAYVGIHPARGFLADTFTRGGSGTDVGLGGGSCATSRCIAEHEGSYVVLRGPNNLSLVEVRTDATLGTTATVATGTTAGAIRATPDAILVAYAAGGACTVERRVVLTTVAATLTVPSCLGADAAELADGRLAVAWVDPANAIHVGVSNADLTALATDDVLDATQTAAQPVEVHTTSSGFRVTWVDDDATPLLRSVRFDATATPASTECAAAPGHTLAHYQTFHTVRRGADSAVEWTSGADIYGATFAD
ncbi:MAG: hypothetical protein OHK0013_40680 [Sandaracinaceae bacterium]